MKSVLAKLGQKLRDGAEVERLRDCYLSLMESCLTGVIYEDKPLDVFGSGKFEPAVREVGKDWPSMAHTMIGVKRLRNVRIVFPEILEKPVCGGEVLAFCYVQC